MRANRPKVIREIGGRSGELHDRTDGLDQWRSVSDLTVTVDTDGKTSELRGDEAATALFERFWGGGSGAPCREAGPTVEERGAAFFERGSSWLRQDVFRFASDDVARSALRRTSDDETQLNFDVDHTTVNGTSCGSSAIGGSSCEVGDDCFVNGPDADGYLNGTVRVGDTVVTLFGQGLSASKMEAWLAAVADRLG